MVDLESETKSDFKSYSFFFFATNTLSIQNTAFRGHLSNEEACLDDLSQSIMHLLSTYYVSVNVLGAGNTRLKGMMFPKGKCLVNRP